MTDEAIRSGSEFVQCDGKLIRKLTTKGWDLCIQWKDGSTSWEPLASVKESNPVEVAEYAMINGIAIEPAFAWWVPYTLKRRARIVKAVNSRYLLRKHKYGVELPKTLKEAIEIDRKTGTTYWRDAVALEVKNVDVAFKDLRDDEKVPVGYQFV